MANVTSVEHQAASVGRVPAMGKWQTAQCKRLRADDKNGILNGIADGHLMLEYWLQWDTCKGGHRHDIVSHRLLTGDGLTMLHLNTVKLAKGTVGDILHARHVKAAKTAAAGSPVQLELTE